MISANKYDIIRKPLITEKSTVLGELGKYVFEVEKSAEKGLIKKAIEEDWWSQRISYIKEAKQKILNELQFFPRLEKIIL
jgi:ribosomal protein L23